MLYFFLGYAAWLVWKAPATGPGARRRRRALTLYAVQLALNFAWSFVFFKAHEIGWAALDFAALWIMAALTARAFQAINRTAFALLLPYMAWLSYALTVNLGTLALN